MNGCQSPGKANWSPLVDRHVIIWPDHDLLGEVYAYKVAFECQKVEVASVKMVRLEVFLDLPGLPTREILPDGWDAADFLEEGGDVKLGKQFLSEPAHLMPPQYEHKKPGNTPKSDEPSRTKAASNHEDCRYTPFEVVEWQKGRRNGTYYLPPANGDQPKEPIWFCSPLHITARTRDVHQGSHGRLLEFKDLDNYQHQWAMPMEILSGDGTEYRRVLLSMGLEISHKKRAREFLAEYLNN
jgi:putative DNA primase/helicase